jgi:predicted DNA-binding transcriptional regulator YafY
MADKLHRITELKRILQARRTPITLRQLMQRMECSESTARRALHSYRDDFGAPLAFDRRSRGWYLNGPAPETTDELPGLWFTTTELHALLAARELLRQLQPGVLAAQTAPIAKRIEQLLAQRGIPTKDLPLRIHLQAPGMRQCAPDIFARLAAALFERRRLHIRYAPRSRPSAADEPGRDISPQRFTWQHGRWYLDAWCHRAEGLRRFAVERIQRAEALDQAAAELPPEHLATHCDRVYGSYTGNPEHSAVLRFTAARAQWVAEEIWHQDQQASWLPDGRYQLTLPYADPEELLLEILKYGPDCEVAAPMELRAAVIARLQAALETYTPATPAERVHGDTPDT